MRSATFSFNAASFCFFFNRFFWFLKTFLQGGNADGGNADGASRSSVGIVLEPLDAVKLLEPLVCMPHMTPFDPFALNTS